MVDGEDDCSYFQQTSGKEKSIHMKIESLTLLYQEEFKRKDSKGFQWLHPASWFLDFRFGLGGFKNNHQ